MVLMDASLRAPEDCLSSLVRDYTEVSVRGASHYTAKHLRDKANVVR